MVRLYYIKECPFCKELKDLYIKNNIPFKEIDVDLPENEEEFNKVNSIAKSEYLPIVLVKKQILVPNKSFQNMQEAYELTKKFLNS